MISYLSSASLLKFINKNNNKDLEICSHSESDLNNPLFNLAFAEKEVNNIGSLLKTQKSIHAKKNKTEAIDESPKYHILHFATHGELNENQPLESSLRLASTVNQNAVLLRRNIRQCLSRPLWSS